MSEQPKIEVPEGARVVERDTGKMHEYRSGEWMPVTEWYHRGEVSHAGLDGNRLYLRDITLTPSGWIDLPDDIRICQRVEPEAITPEALRREGWEVDEMGNAQHVIDGENSRFITVSRIQEVWVHDGRDSVPFHHCETMQDLRALVRMLGGAE